MSNQQTTFFGIEFSTDVARGLMSTPRKPVEITGPTAHPWKYDAPFRVHHYDPKRKGTQLAYFKVVDAAIGFAARHAVYGVPCRVQQSPRLALETIKEKRARLEGALAEQREANRPEALAEYDRALTTLREALRSLAGYRLLDDGRARMPKGTTRAAVERARQALQVLEMNADFAEDGK